MKAPGHQPAQLLRKALSGDAAEWDKLHALCHDRATAEKLGQTLEQLEGPISNEARAWARALEEMHVGLKVKLPERS